MSSVQERIDPATIVLEMVRWIPDDQTPWGKKPIIGKFRIMANPHSEGHVPGTYRIDPTGVPMFEPRVYVVGDIVASRSDLEKHNSPHLEKFRRVDDSLPDKYDAQEKEAREKGSAKSTTQTALVEDLESMTVAQLKQLAEAEGIDLDDNMKKAEMVAWIRESRGANE